MIRYIGQRLLQAIVVLLLVSMISFFLVHLIPGDFAVAMLGSEASPEQYEMVRQELHLYDPVIVQYWYWLEDALQGDFGRSYVFNCEVMEVVMSRVRVTVHVGVFALILTIVTGVFLGIVSAVKKNTALDQAISVFANIGMAAPAFWVAILFILLFAVKLRWLPIQGYTPLSEGVWESTKSVIMPSLMLSLAPMASVTRQTRSSMLEVINQDYIRTARSKGLHERVVIYGHALKNAMIPVITQIGMQIRSVIGGSVVIERVFNLPGMGMLVVSSVSNRDMAVIQGCILLIGVVVTISNLLVDLSYGYFNPKIRFQRKGAQ